jgi:hypothetical protein
VLGLGGSGGGAEGTEGGGCAEGTEGGGCAEGTEGGGGAEGGDRSAAAPAAPPWEAYSSGFGSKMLAKMGFNGGHLGRRPGLLQTQPPPSADAANEERKVGRAKHLGLGAARM